MVPQTLRFSFDIASPPVYKATHPFAIEHALQIQGDVKEIQEYSEKQYGTTIITLEPVKHVGRQEAIHQSQRFTCNITYPEDRDSCSILKDLCNLAIQYFRASRFFCDTGSGMGELKWLSEAHSGILNEAERSLTKGLSEAEKAAFKAAISTCECSNASCHPQSDIEKDLELLDTKTTKRAKHKSSLQADSCEIRSQQERSRKEQIEFLEGGQALVQACKEKLELCRLRLRQLEETSEIGRGGCQSIDATQQAEQIWHDAEEALRELMVNVASRREKVKRQNRVALAQNVMIYQLEMEKIMNERNQERRKEDLRLFVYRALLCLPFCLCIVLCGANLLVCFGLL